MDRKWWCYCSDVGVCFDNIPRARVVNTNDKSTFYGWSQNGHIKFSAKLKPCGSRKKGTWAQRLFQSVSSPFAPNALSPCTQCSVFFCIRDSLQPGYPSHFEVDKIEVCPMALQPLDCRAVQRRLAVHPMALLWTFELLRRHRVAEMPLETAHPIFPQCNRPCTAAVTVCTVATLPLAVRLTRNNW